MPTANNTTSTKVKNAHAVTTTQINPLIWEQALAAADGDSRRIDIVDERTLVVRNQRVR